MKAVIKQIGVQSGTDRSVFVTWEWDNEKNPTEHYSVKWQYGTGDGVWYPGTETTTKSKIDVWSAPSNAIKVRVFVKPISKTKKVNNKDTVYFTADWSNAETYSFKSNPPVTPTGLTAEIKDYKLTASLDNLNVNATHIEFQIVKNDKSVFNTGQAAIKTNAASYSCDVNGGTEYKVCCRSFKGDEYSGWSDYITPSGGTPPLASGGIKSIKALSSTSVSIDWKDVKGVVTGYEIQWTTKKKYFDSSNEVSSTTVESVVGHAEITGLESGQEYFFRVRALNDNGESPWTEISSIIIGKAPSAPTTWSSKTTATTNEVVTLYWVHNTEDGSTQTEAQVEITVNGVTDVTHAIFEPTGEEEMERTYHYDIDASKYPEGAKIQWRVKTKGIANAYSEWSIQRTVSIYAPPTVTVKSVNASGTHIGTINSFPFYISVEAGTDSYQKPIGYHVSVVATYSYETTDQIGNRKFVNAGDEVYSKYFDATKDIFGEPIAQELIKMTPGNIDLENNELYRIYAVVSMDSGLTAKDDRSILISWDDETYYPNAEIGIDEETATAYIGPYAMDENGRLADDILLSVYRREFDGGFTEIATGLRNANRTFVTDPHPSLDYARYRVVAISESTGAISYYDVPGYPVGETAAIIQWSEDWINFDTASENVSEQPPWSGSMVKLRYNIDISENNDPDVELVEYIGRKHPVSYYGTHVGHKAVWNMEIPKTDKETLYALRRLESWMGDVYVREPSGSGYWANVTVSISQKHRVLSVPVTINVTRVEGGA